MCILSLPKIKMKHWQIKQSNPSLQDVFNKSLDVSPIISQLIINRGITDIQIAKAFLKGDVSELFNPFLMDGMHESVQRLKRAIENKEKVLIHGDYDTDGITSIALLVSVLRNFGMEPYYYIPDRLTEGYGLSEEGVKEAVRRKVSLVITVDCGISSYEEVNAINAHNIDVIITDHHKAPEPLPPAYAIINPHCKSCAYPDKNLTGAGIVFKLCEALCSVFNRNDVWRYVDLVALGTVSDVADIIGENRILVKQGIKLLNNGGLNMGLKALIDASGLKGKTIGSFEIGFILGPRINAAGRMGRADKAIRLLLTKDIVERELLAKELNSANRERQRIESQTLKAVIDKIEREVNFKKHKVIVLSGEDWHLGVIGIVASRIIDRFYRPCILFSMKDGIGKGSGRSIENFHLFDALSECGDILQEYGGHKYACGLTILEEDLDKFREAINAVAERFIAPADLVVSLDIDMEIPLHILDNRLIEDVMGMEPFGEGNPVPLFCSSGLKLLRPPMVIKGEHIKMWVTDGKKNLEAIGFGMAKDSDTELTLRKSDRIDLAYTVSLNRWQGLNTVQLNIKDIKPSESCRL